MRALAVGLGLMALAGVVVAFFADTDSTFYLRVIGLLVFGVAGLASALSFVKARKQGAGLVDSAERPKNPESWTPPPLWAPLSGHLMMGALKVPVMVLLLWLAALPGWLTAAPLQNLIVVAVGAVVLGEFLTTLAERPFVLKRRLSAPGGWDYALMPVVIHAVVGLGLGALLLGGPRGGITLGAAYAVATAGEVLLSKSWLPGDTQAEFDEKWRQTKQMTHETFDEDAQEIKRRARQRARDNYNNRKK